MKELLKNFDVVPLAKMIKKLKEMKVNRNKDQIFQAFHNEESPLH
jgi:hypothetical protein